MDEHTDACLVRDSEMVGSLTVRGFIALWRQTSLTLNQLGDMQDSRFRHTVERLEQAGRLELEEHGHLVGIHGLTQRRTRHRIDHAAGRSNMWCALDAIGIPAALGIDAVAHTMCGSCDAPLQIDIVGGVPTPSESLVLWLPAGDCAHLMNDFCRNANLFCGRAHLEDWHRTAGEPRGSQLSIVAAAELGRGSWRDVADELNRTR